MSIQANGQAVESFMSEALDGGTLDHIQLVKCVASAMYAGGADTVRSLSIAIGTTDDLHPWCRYRWRLV